MPTVEYPTSIVKIALPRVLTGPHIDVADDGSVRGQDLAEKVAYEITVTHPLIEQTEVDQLLDFYDDNRTATIRITAGDQRTYDCIFSSAFGVVSVRGVRVTMRTRLKGNRV